MDSLGPRLAMPPLPISQVALFLDLDGTLARHRENPCDVGPDAGRTALLAEAGRALAGRVALISGRTVADVDAIVERSCVSVAGVHGLQRRSPTGEAEAVDAHAGIAAAINTLGDLARSYAGLVVEPKGQSVALHYRRAPEAEAAVVECVSRLAEREALVVQRGEKVIELKTPGPDKGAALRRFLTEVPFRGHLPLYIGDDLTDESAFAAAAAAGGFGIIVGDRRPTAATLSLADPPAVLGWLSTALDRGAFDLDALPWVV